MALAEKNGVDRERVMSILSSSIFDCLIYKVRCVTQCCAMCSTYRSWVCETNVSFVHSVKCCSVVFAPSCEMCAVSAAN
jgi:3-hydroxyisobutyrate dehydrogenase-like beta-hydroxyacid dehydrogenase